MMKISVSVKSDLRGIDRLKRHTLIGVSDEGRAGFYRDQRHPRSDTPLSDVAYFNTFGTKKKIPKRPFFQQAVKDSQQDIGNYLGRKWGYILNGMPTKKVHLTSAEKLSKWISNVITNNNFEPNAKETIRKKGEDNPLTETGTLANSVRVSVEKSNGKA